MTTQIQCPSCAAAYRVPEAAVAARRPLRCAKCGTEWRAGASPTPFAKAVEAVAASALKPVTEGYTPPPRAHDPLARPYEPPGPALAATEEAPAPLAPTVGATLGATVGATVGPLRGAGPMAATSERLRRSMPALPLALLLAWAASVALVLGGVAAALIWRAEIAAAWPPFGHVAGWIGG